MNWKVKEIAWCLVTHSKDLVQQYKVRSKKDPRFLPLSKEYKAKLIREWLWENIYSKHDNKYYLPWSAYSLPKMILSLTHIKWMRDYQIESTKAITNFTTKWLIIVSGTGTWKSWIINDIYNNILWDCVVITSRKTIKLQLEKRLWCEVLCMPTFTKRFDELNDGRILLFDEAHNTSNLKMWELFRRRWRMIWFTATPYRAEIWSDWMEMMRWTIYDTKERTLNAHVYFHKSTINYTVQQAVKITEDLPSTSPERLKRFCIYSRERNKSIVNITKTSYDDHRRVIIFLDREKHIDYMTDTLRKIIPEENVIVIKWKTNKKKFFKLLEEKQDYVIVASISCAKEWLDIPDLRVAVCASNPREKWQIVQMIWRVTRFADNKKAWIIHDFQDTIRVWESKPYYAKYNQRKKIYESEGHTVKNFISFKIVNEEAQA